MEHLTNNTQPNPATTQSFPVPVIKLSIWRNKVDTNNMIEVNGKQVPAWVKDDKGGYEQISVNPAEAQEHDTIVITNFGHLGNRALAQSKIDKLNAMLPNGLRYAPNRNHRPQYSLQGMSAFITSKGSLIGWVCKDDGPISSIVL
jgi:hypothetical protein